MVIWVCEASEVNNLTVLAVWPNHRDNNEDKDKDKDKIASSRSDPPKGSDKNTPQNQYFFANAERMDVHCLESGCIGKYILATPV